MVEPAQQDLYLMQNEFGLIKIGRSVDVERRRVALQTSERCRISIVEVFTGCGDMEEDVHIEMADHHLAGEWFDGTDEAIATLSKLVDCSDPRTKWPHRYDREKAALWLDHINVVRHATAIRKDLYREITILRAADGPSWIYDSGIFFAKWRAATGQRPFLHTEKVDGRTATRWHDTETQETGLVPTFTQSVETALLAWPEDIRPAAWEGGPIACCIAALTAIRDRLPKVPRPPSGADQACSDNRTSRC